MSDQQPVVSQRAKEATQSILWVETLVDDRDAIEQAFARVEAECTAEVEKLREENARLKKLATGQWFYPPDDYDSELCMYSPGEVIEYLDLEPGEHVVEVNVATSLPSIWCAVHVTDDDDADERVTFTEHGSRDDAQAAITANQEAE